MLVQCRMMAFFFFFLLFFFSFFDFLFSFFDFKKRKKP